MIKQFARLMVISLLWMQQAAAEIDAMELALQYPYQDKLSLRWDNIATNSLWFKGVSPVYDAQWKTHVIHLKTSEQSSFYLPANESFRLYNPSQKIQANDITVHISDGTGLLAQVNMKVSTDQHSLILSPQSAKSQIIQITHSGHKKDKIELAVMVSRQEQLKRIAPYLNLKGLSGRWAWLSTKTLQIPEIYWHMLAHKEEEVEIEGPARIALKNRLQYEPMASELIQEYRIRYQLNGSLPVWLDFETGAETSRYIFVNARLQTLGRQKIAYIEIPAGHHRLKLISDRNLYLQVLEQGEDDYLLPMLNEPPLPVQTIRKNGLMNEQKLPKIEKIAQQRVRDNTLKSSGLSGTQILKQAALQHIDNTAALKEAKKLYGHRTFYRNLLPSNKYLSGKQFNAYFVSKRLNAIRRPQYDAILSKQHQKDALKRLGSAYFSPVADGLSTDSLYYSDRYVLTRRTEPSSIKIIVDKRGCKERHFNIQMDTQAPQSFTVQCHENVRAYDDFVISVSETALSKVKNQLKTFEDITLTHLFSANRRPATFIPVVINEISLPTQVRELKVWSDDNDKNPLNIALQIRSAKPFQFSEQSYLARLHDISNEQIFNQFVLDMKDAQGLSDPTMQQLKNDWIPLKRFLTGLYRHYKNLVAEQMPVKSLNQQSQLQKWKDQAKQAEQQQQWIEALNIWTRVVDGSNGQTRDRAQLSQTVILKHLSENFLAQSLWRYLSLYAHDDIALQAENQLLNLHKKQQNPASIQTLLAARFIHQPDLKRLYLLMKSLLETKDYRYVLLLGLMDTENQVELMLKAAYQLEWWQTYQQLLARLPEKQQWFWTGLKAQKKGDYRTALSHWKKSGSEKWLLHLQTGMGIRSQLSEHREPDKLYSEWSQWQQKNPGMKIWQDASEYVSDAFGTDQYYSVERDLYSKAFRGTTIRPISVKVMGPVTLKFKIRVLHRKPDSQLDGWVHINDNQNSYRYPFSNSKPVPSLVLTGVDDYLLGNLISFEYQVGQGYHEIKLFSDQAPISVSINEQQAELPLSILAPLHLDTFLEALSPIDLTENQLKELIPVKKSTSIAISDKDLTLKNFLELSEIKTEREAENRMIECLALMEQKKENSSSILFVAEQLHQRFSDSMMVHAMWRRISRFSHWLPANSIASNGGIQFIETQGWQTGSPALGVRKALISQTYPNEHVLFADQRLLMIMTNLEARTVHVKAMLDELPFLPDGQVQLEYQIDNLKPQYLTINNSKKWTKFTFRVPAGLHQIRFSLIKPVNNQFVKLHLYDGVSDMNVSQERMFFVSTHSNPLQLYVKGPAVIRIDEWLDGKITPRFDKVTEDWELVTIPPAKKQTKSLLKVWQQVAHNEPKQSLTRKTVKTLKKVAEPEVQFNAQSLAELRMIDDDFKLDQQTLGTWSIGTDLVRRNNIEEDRSSSNPVHYEQFRLTHRYFDEYRDRYWNSHGFVRVREHGNPSLGIKESLTILGDKWPFTFYLEAKAITQIVDKDPEWLGEFKMALSQSAHLTPKTILTPKLSWYGRYMSLRNSGKVFKDGTFKNNNLIQEVDQDLYTAYKAQHTSGLSASLLLTHDPWVDTRWTAKIKSFSNEDMNFFNPDHFSTEAHWKQLLGEVVLDASYRINFYQKDKDRRSRSQRQFTKLQLNWSVWTHNLDRFEINTRYNYDIDNKEHLGVLSFSYHFGDSKGYRDFKPGEVDFRNIKERQRLDE